jgi:hypothetical protein
VCLVVLFGQIEHAFDLGQRPESFPVRIDGTLGNVEDSDVLEFTGEKVIDQRGFTAADIHDRCRASRSRLFDKRKGRFKVWAIPAHCLWSFLCVNLFPMSLYVHPDQRHFIDEIVSMISESQNRGEKHAPVRNGGRMSGLCIAKSHIDQSLLISTDAKPKPTQDPRWCRPANEFFASRGRTAQAVPL